MDETKLTADLPNLRMEVLHRVAEDGSGEMMTIQLHATPDFRQALPLLGPLSGAFPHGAFTAPWTLWLQASQALLAPWMGLVGANPLAAMANDDFFGKFKK